MKKSCLIAVIATLAAVDKAETVEPAAEQPAEDPSAEDAAE